ncbi:L domain [Chlorella sorokiniana]|uniref:L domain n=1 Tax=Chlorella sorokiniana TaxID=3076 RepID=A0A2P6TIP0_CHLSO|nr:L domain [Chlorella sorokiniana]|eukprot:PRW39082.1 L domain [Chlorella sorokiniana]
MAAPTGASARRPAGAVSIDDLPPGVLGRIFALAGSAAEIGPSVTLVSHAWRSRQGLRHLMLRSCDLVSLPDGPYLQGLEHLDVGSNRLTTLPPALPATLTKLVLSYNRQLVLSDADVDRLLGLPRLAELSVRDTATSVAVLERLFAAPNLRIA